MVGSLTLALTSLACTLIANDLYIYYTHTFIALTVKYVGQQQYLQFIFIITCTRRCNIIHTEKDFFSSFSVCRLIFWLENVADHHIEQQGQPRTHFIIYILVYNE